MNFLAYKMQLMCLLVITYITYSYIIRHAQKDEKRAVIYMIMLLNAGINIILDMATVYTVNHLESVNALLNRGAAFTVS